MKKYLLLALVLFSLNLSAQSCDGRYQSEIFDSVVVKTVDYGLAGSQNLKMDIYSALADTATERPVVIFCFGGSFIGGSRTSPELVALAESFARRGFLCASIDYRVASNPFALGQEEGAVKVVFRAIQDGKAAIRYFRKDARNGNALGVDSNQIFIGGTSAGGILAINLAYADDVSKLKSTWQTWAEDIGGLEGNSGNSGYCSAPNAVFSFSGAIADTAFIDENDVPLYANHATGDQTVDYDFGPPYGGLIPLELHGTGDLETRMNTQSIYNEIDTYSGNAHPVFVDGDSLTSYIRFETTKDNLSTFFYNILDCNASNLKKASQQDCSSFVVEPIDSTGTSIASLEKEENDFVIYPNPSKNYLVLKSEKEFTALQIVDVFGRIVFTANGINSTEKRIDCSDYSKSTYAVRILINDVWQTRMLLIE